VGIALGTATTDPDGSAILHVPAMRSNGEVSMLSQLAGLDFSRVTVEVPALTIGGTAYCAAKAGAAVTCESGVCPTVGVLKG
jgi:hypothetical protein